MLETPDKAQRLFRPRSQGRLLAMQSLCIFDVLGDGFAAEIESFLRDSRTHVESELETPVRPEIIRFARSLAEGAWRTRAASDALLARTATDWSVERMTPVDRSILRLGVYELLECPETPFEVVISEALELAHAFGDAASPAFVNGIIDAIRRGLHLQRAAGERAGSAPSSSETT